DVQASGPALDGELHADLEEADFLAVFPLAGKGRARLIGTVRDERAEHADTLKFEDVSRRIIDNLKVKVEKVLDLPHAPSRDGAVSQREGLPARRRSAHS